MTFYFLGVNKIMESKELKEKITCGCGAVVIKSNLKAHLTTKKHLASTGQLASVVPTNSKKAPTNSKKAQTNSKKKKDVQWQEPDNEEDDDEEFEDELDDAVDEEGAFEDEIFDVLELLTQKVDNLINQNVISKVKDVLERFNNLETSFKQSHNELVGLIRELNSKVEPVRSIPPLPQRANEKCL
jgi:small-conductance mechanosensitive channel